MKFNEETLEITFEIGDDVDICDNSTPEARLIANIFKRDYLFQYFKELSSGQTGYGLSFNDWLYFAKGWLHISLRKYKKVEEIS